MIKGSNPSLPNEYLMYRIAVTIAQVGNVSINDNLGDEGCTELDIHANMCILEKHYYLLSELSTAQTVSVGVFLDSTGGLNNIPIVNAMLAYYCERTNQVYLLVLQYVLYIESMDNNLIPPFILQEAGLIVNERVKIHCEEGTVTEEDHTIQEHDTGLFITMQLRSIFSYFLSRKPNKDDLEDGVIVVMIPEGATWDAYDQNFTDNKRSMTNRKGELRPPKYLHKEFIGDDDLININLIMVFNTVNCCDKDAVVAAFDVQDMKFIKEDIDVACQASEMSFMFKQVLCLLEFPLLFRDFILFIHFIFVQL